MAAEISFVSEINSKSMNWKLKVRIVRLWKNPDRDRPDNPYSIEIVLMDEKGDRIHATIGRSFIQRFKQQIKEIDVIGEVVSYEDEQTIMQDDNIRWYMNIEIQDYESNNIFATLWGDFVEQIKPYLNESDDKPVVVVMQLFRSHRYREQYSVRNTWHTSKLWINSNLPQVVDFCSRMVSVRGEGSQRITQISSYKTHFVANELASGSIQVKNIEDLGDCKHPENFWIVATIVHVELDHGWCYLACKNCAKKLDKEGNKFYCKKCEQIQSATHRYRLQVKVMDCTGTISLLLWDREATKIIGNSANDLKDALFETSVVADNSSCPMEIENIIEKRYMFKVEVKSSYNQNTDEVLKVVTLTDDEEIIKKYIPSPQEDTFKDSTEDNEFIDVANTPAKIRITNPAAVVEEDSSAQLSENKIKRVFKKKKTT